MLTLARRDFTGRYTCAADLEVGELRHLTPRSAITSRNPDPSAFQRRVLQLSSTKRMSWMVGPYPALSENRGTAPEYSPETAYQLN